MKQSIVEGEPGIFPDPVTRVLRALGRLVSGRGRGRRAQPSARAAGDTADAGPDLHMLNVVVDDMAASLEFYRRLGVVVPEGDEAVGPHVQLPMPGGFSLELDAPESVRLWHAGWRADPASVRVVVGFALPSREAVDERYAALTQAGYEGRQPPFDAFWGARYAIVADPDGNDVSLMSPIDDSRRTDPPMDGA